MSGHLRTRRAAVRGHGDRCPGPPLLLTGPPGSGKTTLLHAAVDSLARGRMGSPSISISSTAATSPERFVQAALAALPEGLEGRAAARAREADQLARAGRREGARAVQALLSAWTALDTVEDKKVVLASRRGHRDPLAGLLLGPARSGRALRRGPGRASARDAAGHVVPRRGPQAVAAARHARPAASVRGRAPGGSAHAWPARGRLRARRRLLRLAALRADPARPAGAGRALGHGLGGGDGAGRASRAGLPPHLRGPAPAQSRVRHVQGGAGRGRRGRGAQPHRARGPPRTHAGGDPRLPGVAARGGRPAHARASATTTSTGWCACGSACTAAASARARRRSSTCARETPGRRRAAAGAESLAAASRHWDSWRSMDRS